MLCDTVLTIEELQLNTQGYIKWLHTGVALKHLNCIPFYSVMAKIQQSLARISSLGGDKAVLAKYFSKMQYKSQSTMTASSMPLSLYPTYLDSLKGLKGILSDSQAEVGLPTSTASITLLCIFTRCDGDAASSAYPSYSASYTLLLLPLLCVLCLFSTYTWAEVMTYIYICDCNKVIFLCIYTFLTIVKNP